MTDLERLELAAKAARCSHSDSLGNRFDEDAHRWFRWNPLESDADAFRVAVKLKINIQHDEESPVVWVYYTVPGRFSANRICENYGDDSEDATRRAIMHAAAEIGAWMS